MPFAEHVRVASLGLLRRQPSPGVLDQPNAGGDRLGGECAEALHGRGPDLERQGHQRNLDARKIPMTENQ